MGPSGSGKSTLFHILGGLMPATSRHRPHRRPRPDEDVRRRPYQPAQNTVGFVFQKYNLLPTLSARDNIAIARHIAGRPLNGDPWFNNVLDLLGIRDRMGHKPRASREASSSAWRSRAPS